MKTKNTIMFALFSMALAACGNGSNSANTLNGLSNTGTLGVGGCAPISGQLPFTVQGGAMDDLDVVGGNNPYNSIHPGTWGQSVMGGSGVAISTTPIVNNGYGYGNGTYVFTKQSYQGTITLQLQTNYRYIIGQPQLALIGGNTPVISGVIALSSSVAQVLQASAGYFSATTPFYGTSLPYGTIQPAYNGFGTYPAAGCVTNVGFDAVVDPSSGTLDQAVVYLYMNNSGTPTPIVF